MRQELCIENNSDELLDISKHLNLRGFKKIPDFIKIQNIPKNGICYEILNLNPDLDFSNEHFIPMSIFNNSIGYFVFLNPKLEKKVRHLGFFKTFQEKLSEKICKIEDEKNFKFCNLCALEFGCCFVTDSRELINFVEFSAIEMRKTLATYRSKI